MNHGYYRAPDGSVRIAEDQDYILNQLKNGLDPSQAASQMVQNQLRSGTLNVPGTGPVDVSPYYPQSGKQSGQSGQSGQSRSKNSQSKSGSKSSSKSGNSGTRRKSAPKKTEKAGEVKEAKEAKEVKESKKDNEGFSANVNESQESDN